MSEPTSSGQGTLPLSGAQRVNEVCNRFELAWKAGQRPRIEDFLGDTPEPERSALLRELLALDIDYRRRAGDQPPKEESQADLAALPQMAGYELLSVLGRGGMGVVYQARQAKLNRVVALKMIVAGAHANPAELKRFRTEAEAIARLQHPNIVQIYEVGEQDGLPFFSLEYCAGGSLAKKLAGTPLPATEAAQLVETLARAMQAAHENGVVHRDLKPANILLSPVPSAGEESGVRGLGTPKITDFGLAKKLDEQGGTATGVIIGTPSYMAPEQASGKTRDLGPACDVYALGAILYECLTGRPPFKAATQLETLSQVIHDEPVPPTQLQSRVPCDLETICLKCLQKEPGHRYATAVDLASDLGRFQRGEPIQARPVGRLESGWRWCKRNPNLAAALAAVLLMFAIGGTTSTVLALVANKRAEEAAEARAKAEREADNARNEKTAAVAARNDLLKANAKLLQSQEALQKSRDRLLSSVAQSLLRPLALQARPDQPLPPLTDPEIEVLWDLAASREEPLRLRFVEEALRTPFSTRQLKYRTEVALHAVVGLNLERRAQVEQLLGQRLDAPGVTPEQQLDIALMLARFGVKDPAVARKAAQALTRGMTGQSSFVMAQLVHGLRAVASGLESKEAAAIFTQALTTTSDPYALQQLAQGLSAVASSLEPKEAAALCGPTVAVLARAMTTTKDASRLPLLVRGMSEVATHLDPKEAHAVCAQNADLLADAMTTTKDPLALRHLAEGLSAVAARLDSKKAAAVCGRAAHVLAQAMLPMTPPPAGRLRNPWLAEGLAALAPRLEPKDAALIATILAKGMTTATDSNESQLLAWGLSVVTPRLEPKEIDQTVAILTQAMTAKKDPYRSRPLAEGLAVVASNLKQRETALPMAATLAEIMTTTKDVLVLFHLAKGLSAAASRLEPKEAAALCGPAAATLAQALTKDPNALPALAAGLAMVASHLEPKEAADLCSPAAAPLAEALATSKDFNTSQARAQALALVAAYLEPKEAAATLAQAMATAKDPMTLSPLAKGLSAVAPRLRPIDAGQAAATLCQAMATSKNPMTLHWLAQGLAALAPRLEPNDAGQTAAALTKMLPTTKDAFALRGLVQALSAVVARLGPKEAGQTATVLAQAMRTTKDSNALRELKEGLVVMASYLEPSQAGSIAATLVQALAATNDPMAFGWLAEGLSAVVSRLDPKEAAAVCGPAARTLNQAFATTKDPYWLQFLTPRLAAVASHLEPKQASPSAANLLQAMTTMKDPNALPVMARGLSVMASRLEPNEAAVACSRAAAILIQRLPADKEVRSPDLENSLLVMLSRAEPREQQLRAMAVLAALGVFIDRPGFVGGCFLLEPALRPLACPLTDQQLVELLKNPCCVGHARRIVLDQLARSYRRPFADVWEFVRFAEEQRLDLDFTGPAQRPTTLAAGR
jgi:serine/threonine protein kinase